MNRSRNRASRLDRFNAWLDGVFARMDDLHRWLMEPGPGQYGPGLFDFEPDWTLRRVRVPDDSRD